MKIGKEIKQSKFDSPRSKVLINLMYTTNLLTSSQNQLFKKYRIQSQHYNVLRIINGRHPSPVNPGHIKEVMLDKGRDLTRLLDKLENLGLISRSLNNNNRRMIDITLSSKGLELTKKLHIEISDWISNTILLNPQDANMLSDLLDKLRQ